MQETEESIAEFSKFCLEIQLANNSNNDENKCKLIHKVVFSIKILSTFFPDYVHSSIVVPIYDDEERVYLSNFWCSKVLKEGLSLPIETPLHGILASCELMEESKLNEAQAELVKTIQVVELL
ncbi:hypothetical protein RhiirA4_548634 [Rhizophagus irregularis]|uniref:Uncharacterized protein n=1 Tax=Rhizophagus irregularis TaxID=588596 RepID=A0A2I1H8N5_9GLOM|nr:hypothetical protein RhiirA4_548634 [Rhizophagus irregularis]